MGKKGGKLTNDSTETFEWLLDQITELEGISSKKMFGGYGLFHEQKMFGMVTSKGILALRANDDTKQKFLDAGGEKHSRMSYYSVTSAILDNQSKLVTWVSEAITVSKK